MDKHQGKALREKLKEIDLTQDEISGHLGMSRQNLNHHMRKDILDEGFVRLIKERLGFISLENGFSNEMLEKVIKAVKSKKGTPVYAVEATAGNMELNGSLPEVVEGYINLPSFKDCFAFLYVRGDSMYPKFKAGDLIGLAKLRDIDIIQYGQVFLVITKDDQRMIKYVRKGKDDNHLVLRSENKEYDDISLDKKKVSKMFMVKGPIRDDWQ